MSSASVQCKCLLYTYLLLASLFKRIQVSKVHCVWPPYGRQYRFQECIVSGVGSPKPLCYHCIVFECLFPVVDVDFHKKSQLKMKGSLEPKGSRALGPQCQVTLCVHLFPCISSLISLKNLIGRCPLLGNNEHHVQGDLFD